MFIRAAIAMAGLVATTIPASAAETITYRYDAKGRLVQVQHTGNANNGVTTTYAHDRADNRTVKRITGAP